LESDDNKLARGLALELGELAFEGGLGGSVENSGIVDHTPGEFRESKRVGRKRDYGQEQCEDCANSQCPKLKEHDRGTAPDKLGHLNRMDLIKTSPPVVF